MTRGMTAREADWILWGLALQAGLCPRDRIPVDVTVPFDRWGWVTWHCWRCHRDWFLDPQSGQCAGWWLTPAGWGVTRRPYGR